MRDVEKLSFTRRKTHTFIAITIVHNVSEEVFWKKRKSLTNRSAAMKERGGVIQGHERYDVSGAVRVRRRRRRGGVASQR